MPSEPNTQPGGSTPFPNVLIDKVMPRLRDTEWRLLTVLIRQTLGWNLGNGQRKVTDWLSHGQLRRKTGRSSAAISLAIEFLCRNNLIRVSDGRGQPLQTAFERRRNRGRIYFMVDPEVLSGERLPGRFKSRIQKPGMTKNTQDKKVVVPAEKQKRTNRNDQPQGEWGDWQRVGDLIKGERHFGSGAPSDTGSTEPNSS